MVAYYVKNGGSDGLDGLSDGNAWETISKVNGETFNAGDTISFKRGSVWRERLEPPSSGSSGNHIVFQAYDSGPKPRITGFDTVSTWSDAGSDRWDATIGGDPWVVLINDVYGLEQSSKANVTAQYEWYFTGTTLTVYATSDPDTNGMVIEEANRWGALGTSGESYLDFQDVNFDGGSGYTVSLDVANASNLRFYRCDMRHAYNYNITPESAYAISDVLLEDCFSTECGAIGFNMNNGASANWTLRRCHSFRDGMIDPARASQHNWGAGFKMGSDWVEDEMINHVWEDLLCEYAGIRWDGTIIDELNKGWGIWIDTVKCSSGDENIVRNCISRYNSSGGFFCEKSHYTIWHHLLSHDNRRYGMVVGAPYDADPESTENNLIYHLTAVGNGISDEPGDCNLRVQGGSAPTGPQLVNNTFYNIILDDSQSGEEARFIQGGDNGTWGSGNVYQYLCFGAESTGFIQWGGTAYSTYAAWETAYGSPTNFVNGDPLLLGPPDYRLDSSSPAIDKGVVIPGINDGYSGIAPDLGYVEFVPATATLPFLPNEASATYLDQAEPDSQDFEYLKAGSSLEGVVSGGAVTQSSPTGMTVDVAAGVVRFPWTSGITATPLLTIPAADPINPRFDIVFWRATDSNVAVQPGTPATNPVLPPLSTPGVPLAAVYIPAGTGQIFNADILDKRVFIPEATVFNVKDFGAAGDGSNDDTAAIQAAIDAAFLPYGGTVVFPFGNYRTTSALTISEGQIATRLLGIGGRPRITADHNGHCIDLTQVALFTAAQNSIQNLELLGPNDLYPPDPYTPPSTGAGIKMDKTYYCVVRDCLIWGFNYGVQISQGIKNVFDGSTYIRNNEIGIYIDGVASNMNNFIGISVRENHLIGIHIDGSTPFPTHNVFSGCLIESNIPFNDGYLPGGDAPNNSVGVLISNGFHNVFNACYFENHEYAVWITGSSDDNVFRDCRAEASGDERYDKIMIDGAGAVRNKFIDLLHGLASTTIVNVESNNVSQLPPNQFIGCVGLNFFNANFLAHVDIWRLERNTANAGLSEKGVDGTYFTSLNGDTLARWHYNVFVDSSSSTVNINLSDNATHTGKEYLVVRNGVNDVNLIRVGTDTFDDAATVKTLATDGASIRVISDGSGVWKILTTTGTVT